MKTLKIAVVAFLAVVFVASVGFNAYSQSLPAPKVESLYLGEDEEGILGQKSFVLPLKFAPASSARGKGGAGSGYSLFSTQQITTGAPRITAPVYVDPWVNYESTLNLNYREVKYGYDDNNMRISILEVMPDGEERIICNILTATAYDSEGNIINRSYYLNYVDEDTFSILVRLDGEPNWDNLLTSASIDDGVFYGVEAGGMVTKSKSEYDSNGSRVLAVMKMWKFNREGQISSVEIIKERSYYNANGDLTRQSTYKEVDGKMSWIETKSRIYIGKTLLMETKTRLDYGDDGAVKTSTNEQSMFDGSGREIRYTLIAYEGSRKIHSVTRNTKYGEGGSVVSYVMTDEYYNSENGQPSSVTREETRFDETTGDYYHLYSAQNFDEDGNIISLNQTIDEEKYDSAGRIVMKRHFYDNQMRPGWGPFQGQFISVSQGEDIVEYGYDADGDLIREHNTGYWFTVAVDPWYNRLTEFVYGMINDTKKLLGKTIHNIEAEDALFENVIYKYDEETVYSYDERGRLTGRSTTSVMEKPFGDTWSVNSYQKIEKSDSEEYDTAGKLIRKYHFYKEQVTPRWGPFEGQTVTAREEMEETYYEYDADGDLLTEHTTGYWFTTYVDPWYEKLVTFLYGLVGDVKKLFNRHESYVESTSADFSQITQVYEKDETYTYTKIGDKVLLTSSTTVTLDMRLDGTGNVASATETIRAEAYIYDASGNVVNKSTTELVNGELRYMELISNTYHANGALASTERHVETHSEWGYSQWEDEVVLYNDQGSLLYKSFQNSEGRSRTEEMTYASDGTTLLTRDIVESNPNYPYLRKYVYGELMQIDLDMFRYVDISNDVLEEKPYNSYELHERYRADGNITYKEETTVQNSGGWGWGGPYYSINEKVNNCLYYPYWGYNTSSSSIERWDYTDSGVLTHYEKEETTRSSGGGWYWYGSSTSRSTKVTRDYDGATGKLMKEEYSVKGDNGSGWTIYPYPNQSELVTEYIIDAEAIWQNESRPAIPEECDDLIKDVTNFFFSHDNPNWFGTFEKKMSLDYSVDGQVGIRCVISDGQGQTVSAFFGTVRFGADGKITAFEVSYTGAWQEGWQALLEGLKGGYGSIDIIKVSPGLITRDVVSQITDNTKNSCELDGKFAMLEEKSQQAACPDGVTMTGELASKQKLQEVVKQ